VAITPIENRGIKISNRGVAPAEIIEMKDGQTADPHRGPVKLTDPERQARRVRVIHGETGMFPVNKVIPRFQIREMIGIENSGIGDGICVRRKQAKIFA
jgi:hypothetical protein